MVIALTHMRVPNDQLLAASVPEFDLVLGGHDHERWEELVEPHGVQLIKSGELTWLSRKRTCGEAHCSGRHCMLWRQ